MWNFRQAGYLGYGEVICVAQSGENRPVILVVEDEFLIRMGTVEMISAAGFDVLEAENAEEAILILECRLYITVAFTDINMPGSMDGLNLAAAVRDRWPPIKIVATSELRKMGESDLPSGSRFLPKPYDRSQIVGMQRELTSEVWFRSEQFYTGVPPRSCRVTNGKERK